MAVPPERGQGGHNQFINQVDPGLPFPHRLSVRRISRHESSKMTGHLVPTPLTFGPKTANSRTQSEDHGAQHQCDASAPTEQPLKIHNLRRHSV